MDREELLELIAQYQDKGTSVDMADKHGLANRLHVSEILLSQCADYIRENGERNA